MPADKVYFVIWLTCVPRQSKVPLLQPLVAGMKISLLLNRRRGILSSFKLSGHPVRLSASGNSASRKKILCQAARGSCGERQEDFVASGKKISWRPNIS